MQGLRKNRNSMEDCKIMKQYVSDNVEDCCFFNHCNFCGANFLIEEEFDVHLKRCVAFHKEFDEKIQQAKDIFEKIPNIEEQC